MTTNIIEVVQKNLETSKLKKVDPNIQETKNKYMQDESEKLAQAGVSAVLTGFYSFLGNEEGGKALLSAEPAEEWLPILFKDKSAEVVEKVSRYAGVSTEISQSYMTEVAHEAASSIKQLSGTDASPEKVKAYMQGQRHNILVVLPAALQLGDLLGNDSLDDRTNKMEGPISNFIHKIENTFSGGGK